MKKMNRENILRLRRDLKYLIENLNWKKEMRKSKKRIQVLLGQITTK